MPPSAVNKTTLKRINKEIADIQKAQKSGEMGDILLQPNESNMHLWTGWLPGPPGSPYEGGHFEISIELPKDYPFTPPKLIWKTPIYHCNISMSTGSICLDTLKNNWSPALSIFKVMLSLSALLCEPNPDDPLVREIAMQWKKSRPEHDRIAALWTKEKAATPEILSKRQRFKDGLEQASAATSATSGTSTPSGIPSPRPSHATPVTTSSGRPVSGTSRVASSTSLRTTSSASANAVVDVIDLDDNDDAPSSTGTSTRSNSEVRAGQRRPAEGGDGAVQGRRVRSRLAESVQTANGNAAGTEGHEDEPIVID
ncbi:hypothetical protein NliqN6_3598 [Naganishia liquefaciens]|uniref:UBC core domain-containing protein n=1 Tax=Naganishia liquefaciens TaxID=104408 RepID=A0A8H3TTF5_9TREE|nr:hypothetical protein NliqN6_3598 [Naganishia liquefaciens]